MNETRIREGMDVIGSGGTCLGTVDHLEGHLIKLRKDGALAQEQHFVPLGWVERIDGAVYLEGAGKALAQSAAEAAQVQEVHPQLIAEGERTGTVVPVKSFGELP